MKKLFIILMLLVLGFSFDTKAGSPSDTILLTDVHSIDVSYIPNIVVHWKKGSNNEFVYCIESNKANLYTGYKLTLDGVIDDAGVAYLVANGYPTKSITGNEEEDYYITQVAVWWYYRDIMGDSNNKLDGLINGNYDDKEVTTYIKNLYNGAVKAHNNGFVVPSLDINGSKTLTLNGSYYESDLITVKVTGTDEYTVTINNNNLEAVIVDKNGNNKTTFSSNEQFMIRIPSNNTKIEDIDVNVTVNATGIVDKAYRYKPNAEHRQMALYSALIGTKTALSKSIDFNYKTVEVEFSKIDVTNQEELPGAHLEIRDMNNNVIKSWISTNETVKFKLNVGKYKLVETIAPEGYQLSKEEVIFTVSADGTTSKVVMKNKPMKVVEFKKVDATNNKQIAGATLEIYNSNNELVTSWVSKTESTYIKLNNGKYTLVEKFAPEGYELTDKKIEFEVLEDGNINVITMENSPYIDIPETALNASQIVVIIGTLLLVFGIGMVYKNVKEPKKQ